MISDSEKAQLIEFCAQVNELNLTEKDEHVLRHLLTLIASWELRASLIRKKREKERIERFQIQKGMSFANIERRLRDEYAT